MDGEYQKLVFCKKKKKKGFKRHDLLTLFFFRDVGGGMNYEPVTLQ